MYFDIKETRINTITNTDKPTDRLLLHPYLTLFSRMAVGGVFIFTGIAKLPHIETLIREINDYRILPSGLATVYGHVLPPLEIILGTLLIVGILLRISASLNGLLVLSFTIAKIAAFARGLDISICPCFGPAVPLLAEYTLVIDVALLVLLLQIVLHRGEFLSVDGLLARRKKSINK